MIKINKSSLKTYKFGDIASNISERAEPKETKLDIYVGLEHLDPDCIHIKRRGHPSDVKGTKLRVYPGDIIFGKRRAYQRKAGIVDFDGICSAHAMVVRANPKVILPELLPFFMHSDAFMHRAVDVSEGSLSPTIKWKILADQEFTIPSLGEQKRIAELLWSVDVAKEQWTNCFYLLKQYKKCFMRDLINSREKKVKLKDLFDVNWGNTSITKKSYKETGFDAFSASGLDGKLDFFEHDGPGIVLSAIGAYCGKCFRADGKWTAIKNTITIKPLVQLDIDTYFEILNNYEFWPIDGGAQPFIGIGKSREMLIPLIDTKSQSGLFIKQIQHQSFFLSEYLNKIQDLNKQIINQIFR